MSWMIQLYKTYEQAVSRNTIANDRPIPVSHTVQKAYINISIDGKGNYLRAQVLEEKPQIILPATEKSAGRTSGEAPHPLADKIQYIAGDYAQFGGLKATYFDSYKKLLNNWLQFSNSHPSLVAVFKYISKKTVVADLIKDKILWIKNDKLMTSWVKDNEAQPLIFKVLPKEKKQLDQGNALVCWSIESPDIQYAKTWEDPTLQDCWIKFDAKQDAFQSLCYVSGKHEPTALSHPTKLRHSKDKAKLISANDFGGYTFRGKFTDTKSSFKNHGAQAATIGNITSQKAHNALRWLIDRQGRRNGDQVIVAWAISAEKIPQPMDEIKFDDAYLDDYDEGQQTKEEIDSEQEDKLASPKQSIDLGLSYAKKLKTHMNGYSQKLKPEDTISIMAIDSATKGRMGITYYRESMPADYLADIHAWHEDFAWPQRAKRTVTLNNGK